MLLKLFQRMEQHRSWGNILISIYRIDAHDLKNGNVHVRETKKTPSSSSMNPAEMNSQQTS